MKQLEEVIQEIRELMFKSIEEVFCKEKMDKGEPARAIGNMEKKQ
jgi:hypothetical protein